MNNVLITGASSGIGLELARLFARDGNNLVLVARREELLNKIAGELNSDFGVEVEVIAKDLTLEKSPDEIFIQLKDREIDIVVNNAGFGAVGPFSELDYKRQIDMIKLNIAALTSLTRLFIPRMVEKNSGGILNVGSLAGFQPGPYATIYYATKAFVLSFTEGLKEELKNTNIKITCLAPGPTNTEFGEVSGLDRSFLFKFGTMGAKEVALQGYNGFLNGKTIVIPGFSNKLLPLLVRLSPRFLVRSITAKLNRSENSG
jgi:hypothetical protein